MSDPEIFQFTAEGPKPHGEVARSLFLDTVDPATGAAIIEDRLRQIKKRYDPANLFRLNHNIPPAE